MEAIKARYLAASNALKRLKEDIILLASNDPEHKKYHCQFRNSAIQSFEFSIDTLWKLVKDYLEYKHGIIVQTPTPRSVFREALAVNLVSKEELEKINKMVADRNLTSHTYNEPLAQEISTHLPSYCQLMQKIIDRIQL